MHVPSFFVALAVLIGSAYADLEFEAKSIELKAKPTDEHLPGSFKFKNTGDKDVEIKKIDIGCSCIKATTDKKTYAPGESGTVNFDFKLGSFTGHQLKGLTIVTGEKRTRLQVGVQIPNVITITPNVLEWFVGDKPEAKKFKVVVEHPDPIKITEISTSREGFDHELKTIKEGREYEITLTPESIDIGMLGFLKISTDCKIKKHKTQMAFFAVSRAPKKSSKKPVAPKK